MTEPTPTPEPVYEYLAAELVGTQAIITELPLTAVKYGTILNGAGQITAKLKLAPLGDIRRRAASMLTLPGAAGSYASTPDNASLDITGDLDLRAELAPADWSPAGNNAIVSNLQGNAGYELTLIPAGGGQIALSWGTGAGFITRVSTVATGLTDGTRRWLRATLDVDNGAAQHVVTFYTSTDGVTWTPLGAPITTAGVTAVAASAAALYIGRRPAGTFPLNGSVFKAEVRAGIGGTVATSPDFTLQAPGTAAFSDPQSRPWALTGTAAIVEDPATVITWDQSRLTGALYRDATGPARRAVFVLRDGIIAGAYVWWRRIYRPGTQEIALTGAELWSLARRRRITWQAAYQAAGGSPDDQLDIARDIITRAFAASGGDLGWTLDATTSGRTRDRSYWDYEAKPVAEAVEQLAAVIDGFDFAVESTLAASSIDTQLNLNYPRRGRTAATSGHVFEWGRNVVDNGLEWIEDATTTANSIIGLGTGEGITKVRTRVTDTSAIAEGYPLLEDSISFGDVEIIDTLDDLARAELAQRSRPITLPKVTVLGTSDPPVGAYITGDDCHLVIPAGVDPFWPDGHTEPRRIHAIEVTPPEDGNPETVDITLGEALAGV